LAQAFLPVCILFRGESSAAGVLSSMETLPPRIAQPELSPDERMEVIIMKKRQDELARRERIFDAKRRTIGVDREALDAQVAERKRLETMERKEQAGFDQQTLYFDNVNKLQEMQKQRLQKQLEQECRADQSTALELRREFDLNDPDGLKKERPARDGDDDERCGPSSLQRFAGEDLYRRQRTKRQHQQQVDWIQQQVFEKEMIKALDEEERHQYAQQVEHITALRTEIEEKEGTLREQLQASTAGLNAQIAQQRRNENVQRKLYEQHLEQQELDHNEAFLTHAEDQLHAYKNPSTGALKELTGKKCGVQGNFKRDEFRGWLPEDTMDARQTQIRQQHENMQKTMDAKQQEAVAAAEAEATRKALVGMQREQQRTKREMMAQCVRENRDIAQRVKNRTNYLDTQVLCNKVEPSFFDQFGTTTR